MTNQLEATMNRRVASGLTALGVVAGLILLPAGAASAGICTPLHIDSVLAAGPANEAGGTKNRTVTPTGDFWSFIGTRRSQGGATNLYFYDPNSSCSLLNSSTDPNTDHTDWVAFNTNEGRLPIQPAVAAFQDGQDYEQFVAGHKVWLTSEPTVDQTVGYPSDVWIGDIGDVWMTGGSSYSFRVTGGFSAIYVLRSKPTDSTTFTKTAATANSKLVMPVPTDGTDPLLKNRTGTLTIHDTNIDDWFAVLIVRDGWWGNPVTMRASVTTP
jgi:hypothetical protein